MKILFNQLMYRYNNMEVLEIIGYLGGWVVLTASVAVFIGKSFAGTIADKLKIKWSGEQEEKLEQLRAEITLEHSTFTSILNSYSSSHQFSQSDRIKAVQTLWENTLETRKLGEVPSFFFGHLLESEYNTVYNNNGFMIKLNSLTLDNTIGRIPSIIDSVEKSRPFIGDNLWSLFRIYTILVGRTSWLLMEGKNNKDIKSWHKDEYTQSILNGILDETEMHSITTKTIDSFRLATELFEQKILNEMFKIISGDLAAESDLSKAKKLQELIGQNETYTNPE